MVLFVFYAIFTCAFFKFFVMNLVYFPTYVIVAHFFLFLCGVGVGLSNFIVLFFFVFIVF
jgi:hypothetical protein